MSNIGQILVTTTCCCNVLYSLIYLMLTFHEAKRRLLGPPLLMLWFIIYTVNMVLNLIIGFRDGLRKIHIIIWSIFTIILSIFRWTCLPYELHGKTYLVVSVCINVYILLTFFVMCSVSEKPKQTTSSARQFSESTHPYSSQSTRPTLNETRFEDCSLPSVSKFTSTLEEIDECTSPREVTITKIVKSPSTGNIVEYTTTKVITTAKKDDPSSDMHKIFGSETPRPDVPICVHPFGWNVTGGSAFMPAPPQCAEPSDPLIESFAPSAPTLEDTVDDS